MNERLRVLLVEDAVADAELILAELRRSGWTVEHRRVQSEQELVSAIADRWDVALLDARLPSLDVRDALRVIGERDPDLPALVVSGTLLEEAAAEVMRAGALDFVTKERLWRLGPAIRRELEQVDTRRAARREQRHRAELTAIVGASDDAIIGKDLDGIVRSWNAGAERMYGYGADEMIGRSIAAIFPPDDLETLPALLARVAAGETMRDLRVARRRKDGTSVAVSLTLSPIRDTTGVVTGAAAIARDLTAQHRAEVALRESEERYRLIVDSAREGIVFVDAAERISFANRAFADLLGYALDELIGRSVFELVSPGEVDRVKANLTLRRRGYREGASEFRYRHKDGRSVDAIVSVTDVRDETNDYAGVLAMVTDATDRKRAEAALAANERRLQLLVRQMPAILWTIDGDGVFTSADGGGMAAIPAVRFVGKTIGEIGDEDVELQREAHARTLAGESATYTARLGGRVWDVHAEPLRDKDGAMIGAIGIAVDVTERRHAEEELKRRDRELATLVEHARDAMLRFDRGLRAVYANPAVEAALGVPRSAVVGRRSCELGLPHELSERWDEALESAFATRSPVAFEFAAGSRHLHARLVPEPGADDDGGTVLAVVTDVTELKEAQETLRRSEERFRELAENAQDIVYRRRCDPERSYEYVSPAVETITGYAPSELYDDPGLTLRAIEDADDRDRVVALDHAESEAPLTFRFRRKDGRVVWLERRQRILDGAHGGPVAQGIVRDVTDRVEAGVALRESEAKFRAVFEGAFDAMAIVDDNGRFVDVNEAAAVLYGAPVAELLGQTVAEFDAAPPKQHTARWQSLLDTGALVGEKTLVRRDGVRRQVELNVRARIRPGRHLGILRDVTDRRRLERQLQVTERMEAVGRLAGGIAHDFNNVLLVVRGFASLLQAELDGQPAAADAAEIAKAADRAAALVRQLLAFSRRQVLQPVVLDVNAVVGDLENLLRRLIGEDIALEFALGDGLANVEADPGQIEQLLVNLAANARDAMPDGGTLTVATATVVLDEPPPDAQPRLEPGRYVAVTVADTGVGMGAETQTQIFEPFFTTKGEAGTGLGLATVYGIVTQSGGAVVVDSTPGSGARFTIYLPATDAAADEPSEETPDESPGRRTGGRVLVVEDEAPARELVLRVLREAGYAATAAAEPTEALALAQGDAFDVLLTDVVMPGMSGRALADELRVVLPGLRVVYMSGYSDGILEQKGVGGDGVFLQKPFTPPELVRTVDRLVAEAS